MEYYEALFNRTKALPQLTLSELPLSDVTLSRTAIYAVIFLTIVTYSTVSRLRAWYKLRHIPGPFWCGFSKFWLIRETWHGTLFKTLGDMAEKYGPSRVPLPCPVPKNYAHIPPA
jgi:hypothetical protein